MDYTKANEMSRNIKNAYNLMKQLKNEIDKNMYDTESKGKVNEIINEVSDILEESANEETVMLPEKEGQEKKVLLISSKTQTVTLPYIKEQISTYIEDGKYETEEEVIKNQYTIPISKYKNEALSRVREGYRLARKKEGLNVSESVKYAINLIFERRLHPAVITACNTIDQLDIYLACLDENVPELFDFFEVQFEYPPIENIKIKDKEPYISND